ncbi:MAG: outer membrane beta-barrel protein [Bacteroidota bacterium]
MKYTLIASSILIFLFAFTELDAQKRRFRPKQRFHAGLILGANLSQIDGDDHTGYDKIGVLGGLQGVAVISRRVELVAELLYSQKGAKVEYLDTVHPKKERILGLNYAEVPILVRINITPNAGDKYKKIELEAGFSFAGLVQTDIKENLDRLTYSFTDVSDDFQSNEVNFIIGAQTEIFNNMRLGIRSSNALTRVYVNENKSNRQVFLGFQDPYNFFRNYHLSFYASYQIY